MTSSGDTGLPAVQETGEPVLGLTQHALPNGRLLVLVTTPSRLYSFAGPGPMKSLFAEYPADAIARSLPQASTHLAAADVCVAQTSSILWSFQQRHARWASCMCTACQTHLVRFAFAEPACA